MILSSHSFLLSQHHHPTSGLIHHQLSPHLLIPHSPYPPTYLPLPHRTLEEAEEPRETRKSVSLKEPTVIALDLFISFHYLSLNSTFEVFPYTHSFSPFNTLLCSNTSPSPCLSSYALTNVILFTLYGYHYFGLFLLQLHRQIPWQILVRRRVLYRYQPMDHPVIV